MSYDARRVVAAEIAQLAEKITIYATGLGSKEPALAAKALDEAIETLSNAELGEQPGKIRPIDQAKDAPKQSDDGDLSVDDFILEVLAAEPAGLSVAQIATELELAELTVKRPHLVVKLNRLMGAGKLARPERGHFKIEDRVRGSAG